MYRVAVGNPSPVVPAVGFFSSVPGVERIDSGVLLGQLRSVATRLRWDETLHNQLATMRMVFMPIVNPGGLSLGTRCNPAEVDLSAMRPSRRANRSPSSSAASARAPTCSTTG